jgi:hypothetical protein
MAVMLLAAGVQLAIFGLIGEFWWQVAVSAISVPVILFVFGVEQKGVTVLSWFIPLMVAFSAWFRFGPLIGIVSGAASFAVVTFVLFPLYIFARTGFSLARLNAHPMAQPPKQAPKRSPDELMADLQAHLDAHRQGAGGTGEGDEPAANF